MLQRVTLPALAGLLAVTLLLGGCGDFKLPRSTPTTEQDYNPERGQPMPDGKLTGEGITFGRSRKTPVAGAEAGIGVNAFLWRATLDTLSFMPLSSADPFGGVVITEWYAPPRTPSERFKMIIYILDRQLRADGIKISVFRQLRGPQGWQDAPISAKLATGLENKVLTRARQLRLTGQQG